MAEPRGRKPKIVLHHCTKCERDYDIKEFYESTNRFHAQGRVPYCKTCCSEITDSYIKQTGTKEAGLWLACSQIGIPFIRKVWDSLEEEDIKKEEKLKEEGRENEPRTYKRNHMGAYMLRFKNCRSKVDKWDDFSATDVPLGEIKELRKSELVIEREMANLRFLWGKDKTVEQLQYLDYRYGVYTTDKDLTDYQESQYRNLCVAELDIYEGNEIDKATARQRKIAEVLGIDKFAIDKEKSLTEKTLEYQIAMMENEEPAFHYQDLKKYADFMGLGNYWENHVIRPIKNVLLNQKEYKIIPDKETKKRE